MNKLEYLEEKSLLEAKRRTIMQRRKHLPKGAQLSMEHQHNRNVLVQSIMQEGARHRHNINLNSPGDRDVVLSCLYNIALKAIDNDIAMLSKMDFTNAGDYLEYAIQQFSHEYPFMAYSDLFELVKNDYVKVTSQKLLDEFELYAYKEEEKVHMTSAGFMVRSKSELSIADALYNNGIAFIYEPILTLGPDKEYPDFLIERSDGKRFIWEHIGKTNDESYLLRQQTKLKVYKQNNIVPWDDLILTFDSKEGHLDIRRVIFEINTRLTV